MVSNTDLLSDVMIKITFVGDTNAENLRLVSEKRGKNNIPQGQKIWQASPIVCFQNKISQEEAIKYFCEDEACHKIIVKSQSTCTEEAVDKDASTVMIDRDHVQEAIISCLEEPFRHLLETWLKELSTIQTKQAVWTSSMIAFLLKLMTFEEANACKSFVYENENIVPCNLKEYLFNRDEVFSFGVFGDLYFKVFVEKGTNKRELQDELAKMNQGFFEKYRLEIEQRKLVNIQTMKQGDSIHNENPCLKEGPGGTLGGFVISTNGHEKKYALTCNHLFPHEGLPAYAGGSLMPCEIGRCVFTTREHCMDFAAIEMNEHVDCDLTFRGVDGNRTNARVYEGNIEDLGFVHKIGAGSGQTTGYIVSSEYYDKIFDFENRDYIFLVSGANGRFSDTGDSGSLVFARPHGVKQNYVNVLGMVFGNYEEEIQEPENEDDENASFGVSSTADNISCCYRISPALKLFQRGLGIGVKFKEDLSFSSSSEDSS